MNRKFSVAALCLGLAACGGRQADPHVQALLDLSAAYKPYAGCVHQALQAREDFDGQLARMVVAKGQDGQLGLLAERYLKTPKDAEGLDEAARIEAAQSRLVALGQYGSAQSPMQGAEQVRRTLSMIETMALIADATGAACDVPEELIHSMEKAKNEYL